MSNAGLRPAKTRLIALRIPPGTCAYSSNQVGRVLRGRLDSAAAAPAGTLLQFTEVQAALGRDNELTVQHQRFAQC